jgi:predicted Zn-dependent peptidase
MSHRVLLAALLTAVPALAAPALHVPFERYRLPNGLTVILHEDHRLPTVAVNLWFRVGAKDEKPGKTGFAHLFEHLMFMGTRNVPTGQFDQIMEAAGGQNNASTSEDRTNYYEEGPARLLETFLWLEGDRLATLGEDITQEKLDLQRDVVKNERRQSFENRPYGKVMLALPESLYPASHPYHHTVIGSHADLSAASVEDVKQFFADYYVASNASLVIAGDFKTAEARALVEKYLAPLPARPVPSHAAPAAAKLDAKRRVHLEDAVRLERLVLAYHSPADFEPGDAECDLLAAVLGGGRSSRLYRALVYEQKIAESVSVRQGSLRLGSRFIITATAQPGHSTAELERAIDAELAKLDAIDARELERARAFVETESLRALESPAAIADVLNQYEFRFGDPAQLEKRFLARYDAVQLADLQRVAAEVLRAPRVAIEVVPQTKGGAK